MRCTDMSNDPIGTASARLLAAGVGKVERLFALGVLGQLLDRAGDNGRVATSVHDVAAGAGLDEQQVGQAVERLEQAGSLRREGGGWVIGGWAGWRRSGIPPADALALISEALRR